MIANVVKGGNMYGLINYLQGDGKFNEHDRPHIVAGDDFLTAWFGSDVLEQASVKDITDYLEAPRKQYGTTVKTRITEHDEETGKPKIVGYRDAHVWHCALSLRADEGALGDDKWQAIASDFMDLMGFTEVAGKAPARWVAIHHGASANGNDHIHVAASLVREDGTRWEGRYGDWDAVRDACRELEVKHGLEQLESVSAERGTRGYTPAEQSRVEQEAAELARRKYVATNAEQGTEVPAWESLSRAEQRSKVSAEVRLLVPRRDLARTVRGAATASVDEAEFVRRLRASGVMVRPRFADGRTDVVLGYSVAERVAKGERAVWYGGGRLGRDLALPRLREEWAKSVPEHDATAAQNATHAVAEWTAARRGDRVVDPGRETHAPDPDSWKKSVEDLGRLHERLSTLPLDDRETWARVARDTAGVFAAWSKATEAQPGPYAAAADALSASAQTFERPLTARPAPLGALSSAAMLAASAAKGGVGPVAQRALLRQMVNLAKAVHDMSVATGQARQAAAIATVEREQLRAVHTMLTRYAEPERAGTATMTKPAETAQLTPEQEALIKRLEATRGTPQSGSPRPQNLDDTTPKVKPTPPKARDERDGFNR